ncbi:MAG: hypothetical protein MR455_05015 [Prevotella sp.]|nr:hypothetical protein [Prevotella sp.]
MRNHLRSIVLTLLVLATGMGVFAQDSPVVKSLSEAFELKKNCTLVIEKNSNYKLQLISYDNEYDESYVWDGTVGTMLLFNGNLKNLAAGKIMEEATLNLSYLTYSQSFYVMSNSTATLADGDMIPPVEITSLDELKDYMFVKIKGTISANGESLTTEGGETLEFEGGMDGEPDYIAHAGKTGYVTGYSAGWDGFKVYPFNNYFTEATEGNPDDIDTFDKLKAIEENKMVNFILPKGTQVLGLRKFMWGSTLYLWDGTNGTYLDGQSVDDILLKGMNPLPQPGQEVSGSIYAYYFGSQYNYFNYDVTGNTDAKVELTFGEAKPLTPITITSQELMAAYDTKKYDEAYIRIHGTMYQDGDFTGDDGSTYRVSEFYDEWYDFNKFAGQVGYLTAVTKKNIWDGTFDLLVLTQEFFESEGEAEATQVVYDALKPTTIEKDVPVADVTIKNLNLKAGVYTSIVLPFDLNKDEIEAAFGEGSVVYAPESYYSTDKVDSVFITDAIILRAGAAYILLPKKDQTDVTFKRVNLQSTIDLFPQTVYPAGNTVVRKTISLNGSLNPFSSDNIKNSFAFKEDGQMVAAYGQHRGFGCYFLVDEGSNNFVVKLEGQETAEELVYDVNAKNDIVSVPLANVTIRNLNLKKDELNTICLPFSVSKEEMDRVFGEGTELYETDSYRSMQDADTIFFKPSTGKTIMTGLPYAIKTTKDVTDPTFRQVTVVAEEPTGTGIFWEDNKSLSTKYVRMMGSYSKTTFNPVSYIFINGTLTDAKIINTTEMGGFACQITAEEELKRLAAFINNQLVTDGIAEIEQERQASVRIYNLNGQYVGESPDKLGRGVYIVNGQKVVINK